MQTETFDIDKMYIATKIFQTQPTAYIREIFSRWLMRYIWAIALVFLLFGALAATIDSAFIFVGLMLLFLVFPVVMAFVYFNYGMTYRATLWGRKQRVVFANGLVTIHYEADPENPRVIEDAVYPFSEIRSVSLDRNGDIISFGPSIDDFIIIPADAFEADDIEALESFRDTICQSIQHNSLSLRS